MLRAILNKSWRQHPTRHQLYGHLPPITKTKKLDEPDTQDTAGEARTNSSVMYSYGTPAYGQAKAGRPARTYIQQLCEDTGCSPEDLPKAMNDRRSGERGSGISVLAAQHDDDYDGEICRNNYNTRAQTN